MKLILINILIILSFSFAYSSEYKRIKYFKDTTKYVLNFIDLDEDGFYDEYLFYIVGGEQWQKKIVYSDDEIKSDFHTILKYINSELTLISESFCHYKNPREGIFRVFQITNKPLGLSVVILGGCNNEEEIVIDKPIVSSVNENSSLNFNIEYSKLKEYIVIPSLNNEIEKFSIVDFLGRVVLNSNIISYSFQNTININSLPQGAYFINIELKNGKIITEGFIK